MQIETINRPSSTFNLELYQNDDLQEWVGVFLHACRSRNLTAGTIEFYRKKLKAFLQFCSDQALTNISQITADDIRQFLIILEERKHKPGGIHCYYRSIKTFLKWYELEVEPVNWHNPISKVKAPIVPLEPLDPVSIETIQALTNTCNPGSLLDARDRAALLVLLDTGLRLAEFLGLNKEDLDPITGAILISIRQRPKATQRVSGGEIPSCSSKIPEGKKRSKPGSVGEQVWRKIERHWAADDAEAALSASCRSRPFPA